MPAQPTVFIPIEAFELEKFMDDSMACLICETEDYQGIRDVLGVIRDPEVIEAFCEYYER